MRPKNVPDNFPELLQETIQLTSEVPSRSVDQIILTALGKNMYACLQPSCLIEDHVITCVSKHEMLEGEDPIGTV